MYPLEQKVSDVQLQRFLDDPCTEYLIQRAADMYKDAIVNCTPDEIDKRESAYFMYHAVSSLKNELDKSRMELLAKNSSVDLDNY